MNTRVRMAAGRRVLGVVTIVGLFAAAATASPAAAETGRLWFSVSSDQSFSQSVANYVAQHPSARQLAVSTLNALSADLQAGKAVAIPGTATPTEGLEQVQSASAARPLAADPSRKQLDTTDRR